MDGWMVVGGWDGCRLWVGLDGVGKYGGTGYKKKEKRTKGKKEKEIRRRIRRIRRLGKQKYNEN